MKLIVTGGAGFIGSHLVDNLISSGHEVHVIDNLTTGKMDYINPKAYFHKEDITSLKARTIIVGLKPDAVFHLAAQADVGNSLQNPNYDADVNIKGTINILESCIEANVKKLIFSSTSAVYGNLNKEILSEQDSTLPASYYGLSKLTAEAYIRLFHNLYKLPYTILRYANVYGPRQLPKGEGGVIAVFINKMHKNEVINIHGDGEQTRDFIYVSDIVEANVAALKLGSQETIQVSTSKKISINNLLCCLTEIFGGSIEHTFTPAREGDIKHSCLSNEQALELLQWSPSVDISSGLKQTFDYHNNE